MTAEEPRAGTVFAGDYRITGRLATGGMGSVFRAEQISTGKARALKLLHPDLARDARTRERFELEARVGARIASEHVVEVVGAGIDAATHTPWLAMELLVGTDLGTLVARRGALAIGEVYEILGQLCHALGAAHAAGIVHRDVKPENVFLANAQQKNVGFKVKVLDFGVAKVLSEARPNGPSSTSTASVGTPLWMSPEQAEPGGAISPATDVWALGLLAFTMLTGLPYWKQGKLDAGGSVARLLHEVLIEPIVPASLRAREYGCEDKVPAGFDAWFARTVVREIDARFADGTLAMAALVPILEPLLASAAKASSPSASAARANRPRSRRWIGSTIAGVLVAGGVAVVAVGAAKRLRGSVRTGEIAGAYGIVPARGTGLFGTYSGTVSIRPLGQAWRVGWSFEHAPSYEGVGMLSGTTFTAGWSPNGPSGVVVYKIDNGRLHGKYANERGTIGNEELTGPTASLGGSYAATNGSSRGTVTITPTGETYQVGWSGGLGPSIGVGLRSGERFIVGYTTPGHTSGVVDYEHTGGRLVGHWASTGQTRPGVETLVRR